MALHSLPSLPCAHTPTPLEAMPRLTAHLGGPTLWVKRDDCTGLATGGNKARKLQYLVAHAQAQGANTLVTWGGVGSNHARQTAAAAAKHGLQVVLVLKLAPPHAGDPLVEGGNLFLDALCGACLVVVDPDGRARVHTPQGHPLAGVLGGLVGGVVAAHGGLALNDCEGPAARGLVAALGAAGHPALGIPSGGSNAIGATAYVDCAAEIVAQAQEFGFVPDAVVHASGSAGTQAGLVAGMWAMGLSCPVHGISAIRGPGEEQHLVREVHRIATDVAQLHGWSQAAPRASVHVHSAWRGPGYGLPTPEMVEAVSLAARLEGLLLDPVYSGKALAALLAMVREGRFVESDNLVFIHTGGSASLLSYKSTFVRWESETLLY